MRLAVTQQVLTERAVRWATAWDVPRALDWLETAMRLRIPDLALVKLSPLFDPLRKKPRFQAIEWELNVPN